ncbi:sulfurtransferase TusA family protein [Thiomicrorhabdus sp. 6S3-12]|uniref:sulfurtransferase TusA family protein n=1 Tax=Thiomicrorhabdus sp. 6S3-12 TaxID=2819681 RepID=UPI001AAD9534|nr:sulfurtransferase TusA family protein [Thiomicrorhabdus sp. 6S3-12]MBO1923612.1 sulfurtransferase TusA family protein [Thiomicrorhabdus sp. 6S3-12]
MYKLDCSALACPMPIIKLKKVLHENAQENVFRIQLKDKGGLKDIPAFCRQQGLHCSLLSEEPVIEFEIRR